MKPKPLIAAGIVMAVIAFAAWQGWLRLPDSKSGKSETPTSTATRESVAPKLFLSGEITPAFQVDVKPEVGGKVKNIHVIPGQVVTKGDLLVTIDDTDLLNEKAAAETEIEGANLAVAKTRGNYERAKALYEQKLISKEVFANLEADFKISENTLEKAQRKLQTVNDRLSKTRILSPGSGTILDVYVNEGQVVVGAASVNSGTVLVLFADLSRLLINAHVNQMDAERLSVGQEMAIRFSDDDEKGSRAKIEFIAPVATVKSNIKGFEVQAVIEENQGRLKPGMSVSMDVPVGLAESVVTVPVSAVFKEKDQKVVYVRKGAEVQRRVVAVGLTDMSRAEIKSGLEEGEEILLIDPTVIPPGKS
ncbi:MAG: efflux RND transporter periplasmic adaptor subunit [Terrimicrobiaceae bacterium]